MIKAILNDEFGSDFSFGKIPAVPEGIEGSDEKGYYSSQSSNSEYLRYIA